MKVLVPAASLIRFTLWVAALAVLVGFATGNQVTSPATIPAPGATSDNIQVTATTEDRLSQSP